MKIIHTADWHLGQNFYEYNRKAEHVRFLLWLKKIIRKSDTDVLLIAGDIFDSPNPSAESQSIFFSFLHETTNENPGLQIIIIAGNHDSAARLEAPNPLFEDMNITVRGIVKRDNNGNIDYEHLLIPLNKGGYCLAVPYLRQGDYPDAENYSKSVKILYDKLYETAIRKCAASDRDSEADNNFRPVIATGHLQATGSEISENDRSERTIIGGLECVSPEAFSEGIVYTALGHLHRAQRVSGRENVRYSGTPIPMSFAEKNNKQGVIMIEITMAESELLYTSRKEQPETTGSTGHRIQTINETPDAPHLITVKQGKYHIHIKQIVFEEATKLISIPKEAMPLNDILQEIKNLPEGKITDMSPYLEIKVLISEPEPSMRHRIEEALTGKAVRLTRISATIKENKRESNITTLEELQATNPMDIAEKIFGQQYGNEKIPEPIKKLLHEVIQEVRK